MLRRIIRVLPTICIMFFMLLAEQAGATDELIFCGFLLIADVLAINKE